MQGIILRSRDDDDRVPICGNDVRLYSFLAENLTAGSASRFIVSKRIAVH